MVARTLHYVSLACCAFVAVSFVLFAHAQVSHASSHQAGEIAPASERAAAQQRAEVALIRRGGAPARPHRAGEPRRFIDDVSGKLESPFASIVPSDDAWVTHGIPALLALLVYGGGLGFLSRWAAGRDHSYS